MLWRSIQVSGGLVLAVVLAACSGTSVPAMTPTPAPTASASPSALPPPASAAPAVVAAMTPAAVATATAMASEPASSAGPHPIASPDVAAMIETYAKGFTATIRLLDLADGDLAVTVSFVDPSSAQAQAIGTYTLGSSGQQSAVVPPATYKLAFRQPSTSTTGPTCTITIKNGDGYTFIAVPGAIAVSRAGNTPSTARGLFVPTSALCRN